VSAIAVVASMGLLPWLNKSIWEDEGASLYSAHLSWTALWQQSRVVDLVLLPYYVLLHVWIGVSDGIEWVRLLSVVAFGLTVFLVGHLGNRLGGRGCAVVSAMVLATNPLMVEGALDARPYTLSALATTASVAALIRWFDTARIRWMWLFCLASIAALLFQMFTILVPLAALAVVIVVEPRRVRNQWRGLIAPVALVMAIATAFGTVAASQRSQIDWITSLHGKGLMIALLGPLYAIGEPSLAVAGLALVLMSIVTVAVVMCLQARRRGSFRPTRHELDIFAICVAWAVLPTVALIAASLVTPVYTSRYVTASAPGLALAVGLLTARALEVAVPRWTVRPSVVTGGVAAGMVALVVSACSLPAAQSVIDNLQGAARYLGLHVGPDAEMATTDHALTASIEYYLQGNHNSVAIWPQLPEQLNIGDFDLRQNRQILSDAPQNVWLLDNRAVAGTSRFIAMLTRNGYVRSGTKYFVGDPVVHFRRADAGRRPKPGDFRSKATVGVPARR